MSDVGFRWDYGVHVTREDIGTVFSYEKDSIFYDRDREVGAG